MIKLSDAIAKHDAVKAEKATTFTVEKQSVDGKRLLVKSSKGGTKEWGTTWLKEQLEEGIIVEQKDGSFVFNGTLQTEWA